jgi:4-hydroxythreonine-4-phosphate dehydrogenase
MRPRAAASPPLPLALTLGEPAGIGPDIALQCWLRRRDLALPAFYLIGETQFLTRRAAALGLDVACAQVAPAEAARTFDTALPVVDLEHPVTAAPGRPDASSAPAAIGAIRQAVADVFAGRAAALVTNPIAKSVLYAAGFRHPGHTEYLAHLAQETTGGALPHPVMMIWSETLAVVPVTIHVALKNVPGLLTQDLIVTTARIVAQDMTRRFGIARPRIAVAGLNPHAGENGSIGREDEETVKPAVARLQAEGLAVRGPLSADTLFHPAARAAYDVALCMYHDQALIPVKTLAFDQGVNVTLGLPFVRTSPDHGTAFDIAGTGKANPESLAAALRLAAQLAANAAAPANA